MSNFNRAPFVAALAMLACAGPAQAAELALNGGFESGDFSGWTLFPGAGVASVSTMNPSSGLYSANLDASANAAVDTLIKNANIGVGQVVPGEMITIAFDARGTTANGGVLFAEFFSELDGGGVSATEILGGGPLGLNADPEVWTSFMFTTFAGPDVSGGVTLQLKSACGPVAGCTANVFLDNISVSTSAVPVPAAFWLFGSALAMMGWVRRRTL